MPRLNLQPEQQCARVPEKQKKHPREVFLNHSQSATSQLKTIQWLPSGFRAHWCICSWSRPHQNLRTHPSPPGPRVHVCPNLRLPRLSLLSQPTPQPKELQDLLYWPLFKSGFNCPLIVSPAPTPKVLSQRLTFTCLDCELGVCAWGVEGGVSPVPSI